MFLKVDRQLLYEGEQNRLGERAVDYIIRAQLLAQRDDKLKVRGREGNLKGRIVLLGSDVTLNVLLCIYMYMYIIM